MPDRLPIRIQAPSLLLQARRHLDPRAVHKSGPWAHSDKGNSTEIGMVQRCVISPSSACVTIASLHGVYPLSQIQGTSQIVDNKNACSRNDRGREGSLFNILSTASTNAHSTLQDSQCTIYDSLTTYQYAGVQVVRVRAFGNNSARGGKRTQHLAEKNRQPIGGRKGCSRSTDTQQKDIAKDINSLLQYTRNRYVFAFFRRLRPFIFKVYHMRTSIGDGS